MIAGRLLDWEWGGGFVADNNINNIENENAEGKKSEKQ